MMRFLLILFVGAMICPSLHAQPQRRTVANGEVVLSPGNAEGAPDLFFERVGGEGDLPAHSTLLGQDSSGFLWFATSKKYILRYDGHRFLPFATPQAHTNTAHLIDAATNSIWVTTVEGLCCFDMASGDWQLYPNPVAPPDSIFHQLFYDKTREVLVTTGSADSYVFDLSLQRFTRKLEGVLRNGYSGEPLLGQPEGISDLKTANDGTYWMTAKLTGEWMLLHLDPDSGAWLAYPQVFYNEKGNAIEKGRETCLTLLLDEAENAVWVGGWRGGLKRFDLQTKRWQQFLHYLPEHNFAVNTISGVLPWDERHLLIGSELGLNLFDKRTGAFFNYQFFPQEASTHRSHTINSPFRDRHGAFWFTVATAWLYRLDPHKQLFFRETGLPKSFAPYAVFQDTAAQTACLLGYDFGLYGQAVVFLDEKTGKHSVERPPFVLSNIVAEPEKKRIWIGTLGIYSTLDGLWQLDLKEKKCKQPHLPVEGTGFTTDSIGRCRLSKAPSGDIWLASHKSGLLKYEASTGKCRRVYPRFEGDSLLPSAAFVNVLADKKGRIWLTLEGWNGIACLLNPASTPAEWQVQRYESPPDHPGWEAYYEEQMAETADGSIWAAAGGKLYRLRPAEPNARLEEAPGIAPSKGMIFSDDGGNLWCHSPTGLHVFHAASQRWKTFTANDGLPETPGDEVASSCYLDRMYFTGSALFQPSKMRFNEAAPQPVFTDFKVNEKSLEASPFLAFREEVRLRPGDNSFTVEFAATNFTNPDENSFAYRLSGVQDDWLDIGNRRTASFTNLAPGDYLLELKAANNDGHWNKKPAWLRVVVEPFFYQTTWFRILAALALAALAFLFYRNRLHAARREALLKQREAELRQKEAEFQQQLAEVEMAALRSQMNPHFVFNVLNSIHYFMLNNDALAAAPYLTKFARLVRLVLENSRNPVVPLRSDLEALRLYCEMEALRFTKKMQFHIEVGPDIDQQYVKLPPMLIQPYVENAIWHGLMHKPAGGQVSVTIALHDENVLEVAIEDDGIGREAAGALRSKSASAHKSFGMQITSRRLDLVNKLYQTNLQVSVFDLKENGVAKGTRVMLKIPV